MLVRILLQMQEMFTVCLAPVLAVTLGDWRTGKSTLLNRLTAAGVLAEDKLFATLDPTTRRLSLPSGKEVLLTDTVGFIQVTCTAVSRQVIKVYF